MTVGNSIRVGVVQWNRDNELANGYREKIEELGHQAITFLYNHKIPENLHLIFVFGPFNSLVPLANQLLAISPGKRPLLALLMTEQFPNPESPEWFRYNFGRIRTKIELAAYRNNNEGSESWHKSYIFRWLTSKAIRYRYYGDIFWLRDLGLLSALATYSNWTAEFLRERGFDPIVPTRGFNPAWSSEIEIDRDVPVLWLGKYGSRRRKKLLQQLRVELKSRGVDMMMVDGIEHPYVFGDERNILLKRSKIVLNLMREKWDDNSLRFTLAAHNRAMIISEPLLPHSHFIPGVHMVVAPIEKLSEIIVYYLDHEEEREKIVQQAHQLINKNKQIGLGMSEILQKAINSQK
jgi:hypothetical protein